jgi:phosphoglycerol transferase MdoB-like AlkP superfamily enzyme
MIVIIADTTINLTKTLNHNYSYLISFAKKIALAFLVFSLCRLLFYLFNLSSFPGSFPFEVFVYGLRFDYLSIAYLFSPFIILSVLPFGFKQNRSYKFITKISFHLGNTIGIALNLIDTGYYPFSIKRSTADLFHFLGTGNDFGNMLPTYIKDFWHLFLVLLLLVVFTEFIYRKFDHFTSSQSLNTKSFFIQLGIFILVNLLTIIGFRGGIQFKPIDIVNAANYTSAKNIPLVLNTPFCIIKTILNDRLREVDFYDETTLKNTFNPELNITPSTEFTQKNVIIVILESFAKEYVGFLNNGKGYTPFLDSLMNESYVFTNAYSSGTRSIESLPSIFSGIPPLMNTAYIISNYAANKIDALPAILNSKGYNTSFYHGGSNGTMGFSGFCATAGISNYYGKDEYPNPEKDDDGAWGISDEPYLQYFAKELNNKKPPFFSAIFTLSSHHPYIIPKVHQTKFTEGELPIHKTIAYTDYALKKFFETAKQASWFNNTLFVFTSDHSSEALNPFYSTLIGRNAIPIFIYDPSGEIKGKNEHYFQHTDITPTILNLLGINTPLLSFGDNGFSNTPKHLVGFSGNTYFLAKEDYVLLFDGKNTSGLYQITQDSLMKTNLLDSITHQTAQTKLEIQLKAIIQQYNHRLINNKTSLTKANE